MSARAKYPTQKDWARRGKAMHRIMKRIGQALGPFTPNEMLLFEPKKGFSTFEIAQDKGGKFRIQSKSKPGFFERLYTELPRNLQRRFLLLDNEKPAPTPHKYRELECKILGYARRRLMRELVARIETLPALRGLKGGRREMDSEERQRIRKRVKELMQSGDEGESMSKRRAIETVALERRISSRHVWRIVLGH